MKHDYQVEGSFSFQQSASALSVVGDALVRALKREGLDEKNFEFTIERVKQEVKPRVKMKAARANKKKQVGKIRKKGRKRKKK